MRSLNTSAHRTPPSLMCPLPARPGPKGDFYFCQLFGPEAKRCGHNKPGETVLACSVTNDTGQLTRTEALPVVVTVEGIKTKALIDTGAACSLVNTSAFPTLRWDETLREAVSITLQSVEGQPIKTNASHRLRIGFEDDELVASLISCPNLSCKLLLGMDFLTHQGVVVEKNQQLRQRTGAPS